MTAMNEATVTEPVPAGSKRSSNRGRALRIFSALLAVLVVGAAGGWSLRVMLAPAPDVLAAAGFTLVLAQQGAVGQSLQLNTSARWVPERAVAGLAGGIVTSLEQQAGGTAAAGDVMFTVDLRPVVVAAGEVPAFRDLSRGAEGADVAQLQAMLVELGHYDGEADGVFGGGVQAAVRAWQRDLGVTVDGTVRRGDVIFVPQLPARLSLHDEVTVGSTLGGGEPVLQVLPAAPEFSIALPEGQARLVSAGMSVEIPADAGMWLAEIDSVRHDPETGGMRAELTGIDGQPVCGDDCDQVPLGEATLLPSTIHVVPEMDGVRVPAAAVVTTAAGQTVVVTENGDRRPVDVLASASGMAVVEGIDAGEQVRTPGELPGGDRR